VESDSIDWKEVMGLVNSKADININDLKEELDIGEEGLREIVDKLKRGGIDVQNKKEEIVKERIIKRDENNLRQTNEPIKLYLRELKNISLLTRQGEYKIGARMEKGRKMISKYLFQSIPVIDEFLKFEDRLENNSLPIEQFLYLNNHEWPQDYNGEKERQNLLKLIKRVRKWKGGLVKYKNGYIETGRDRYKQKYKKYEKKLIDEIQTLRIQTPYLKKLLDVQKKIYRKMKITVDKIFSLKAKLTSKASKNHKKCSFSKGKNHEELIGIREAIKNHQETLKEFEREVDSCWESVESRLKKIQKWEEYFQWIQRTAENFQEVFSQILKKIKR